MHCILCFKYDFVTLQYLCNNNNNKYLYEDDVVTGQHCAYIQQRWEGIGARKEPGTKCEDMTIVHGEQFPLRQKCDNTHKKDTLQAHYKHLESFLSSQVYFQAFSSGEIQAREKEQEQWIKYSKKVVKQRKKEDS